MKSSSVESGLTYQCDVASKALQEEYDMMNSVAIAFELEIADENGSCYEAVCKLRRLQTTKVLICGEVTLN